jgi:hypothetical protein
MPWSVAVEVGSKTHAKLGRLSPTWARGGVFVSTQGHRVGWGSRATLPRFLSQLLNKPPPKHFRQSIVPKIALASGCSSM